MDGLVITEKATNEMDLPHAFKADRNHPDSECRCGRVKSAALHADPIAITEQAASGVPALITEKGVL